MLRRVLLAALVCVAVWASGHRSSPGVAAVSNHGTTCGTVTDSTGHLAHLRPLEGRAGDPAHSADAWQSAGAVVAAHTWRLDGHHAELSSAAPSEGASAPSTRSQARRVSPVPPHTFDLPLLI